MNLSLRPLSALPVLFGLTLALAMTPACDSEGDDGGGGSTPATGTPGTGTPGTGTPGTGEPGNNPTPSGPGNECSSGEDCANVVCSCNEGPVNFTGCDNGYCATSAACPTVCEDWGGMAGNPDPGPGPDPDPDPTPDPTPDPGPSLKQTGDPCETNSQCEGGVCLVRDDGDILGYCSHKCDSFADCPSFWDCEELGNAAGTYCVQN